MAENPALPIAFVLLGAAIAAVWWPSVRLKSHLLIAPWSVLFSAAVGAGLASHALTWLGVVSLMVVALACINAARFADHRLGWLGPWVAGTLLLALALHRLPGFHNPKLLDAVRTSADALPFSLHANFDKGSAGLFLLAFFAPRISSLKALKAIVAPTAVAALATAATTLAVACAMGYVRFDMKLPAFTALFLATNLLFTCVAEEAFFRGLIQERLSSFMAARWSRSALVPVLISALLFGLAHVGSGWPHMALASLAGLGYALVYARTRRVEAAVLTHFFVNAVHFVGFSYPALAP